jgi:CheY-like chemotaxis protein
MTVWLLLLLTAAMTAGALWLRRERRAAAHRRALRALFALSEEMFLAATPEEICKRLRVSLPRIAGAAGVRLYLHNAVLSTLDPVADDSTARLDPIPLAAAIGSPGGAAATCFRNKALLPLVDGSSALPSPGAQPRPDPPMLLVPLLAGGEALGVLAIEFGPGWRQASLDLQAAMQHLANQVATALKFREQQSIREKLFRSEKLAAAGQLISGIAGELHTPLAAVEARARAGMQKGTAGIDDLRVILDQSGKAAKLVQRLVAFADPGSTQAEIVDLNELLQALVDLRQQEQRVRGIECRLTVPSGNVQVAGAYSQLEQAFLRLLLHTEQALTGPERVIEIAVSALGRRALIAFRHTAATPADPDALQVVSGIVLGHGGEIRPLSNASQHGYELFLPLAEQESGSSAAHVSAVSRRLTALVADPDPIACREMVRLLGERHHRAVPVANAEEAADLMERVRFDAVFCSIRQPGANWIELRDRSRTRAGSFVLLTEGVDEELSRTVAGGGHLLQKPYSSAALEIVLAQVAGAKP